MQQRARRHHVVPRFYLARFVDASGNILVHDKSTTTEAARSPKSASVETDFYTIDIGSGPSDEIERKVSEIEGRAADALRVIDRGTFPPSLEDRGVLASFMALQFVRGPQFRAMNDNAATKVMQMMSKMMSSKPEYVRAKFAEIEKREPTEAELAGLVESLGRGEVTVALAREHQIGLMLESANAVFPFFYGRKWFLARGRDLLTGDVPVVLWARRRPGFWGIGAMNAEEITMPIDPNKALVLVQPITDAAETVIDLPDRKIGVLRHRLWDHATRFTYRRPGTPAPTESEVLEES